MILLLLFAVVGFAGFCFSEADRLDDARTKGARSRAPDPPPSAPPQTSSEYRLSALDDDLLTGSLSQ